MLDPVGGAIATALMAMLSDGGTLVLYGDLSGQPLVLPALGLSTRDLHVTGVSVGRWAALPDAVRAGDIATALTLARTMPELFGVAAAYDLQEIVAAVQHTERPGKAGAVLLQ